MRVCNQQELAIHLLDLCLFRKLNLALVRNFVFKLLEIFIDFIGSLLISFTTLT